MGPRLRRAPLLPLPAKLMRSRPATPRPKTLDPIYPHVLVTQLINGLMHDGKKTVAQKQVYSAFALLKTESQPDPLAAFLQAMENLRPQMEVRARRIGGAAYQVPSPVRGPRKDSLAIRWLVAAARERPSSLYHTFAAKLAAEITDVLANTGAAIKKKLDMHRMAEANKAFAHFRW